MVGLVVVSHSALLAEGLVELAAQMAGPETLIAAAAGLDRPGDALGTDATRVLRAIEEVWSDDGVLVLMDLGSAVLSAELAVDLLDDARRDRVRLTAAPLVEGAVAAAVAAGLGEPLEVVAAAAAGGIQAKHEQLGPEAANTGLGEVGSGAAPDEASAGAEDGGGGTTTAETVETPAGAAVPERGLTARVVVRNRLGLHARPAARLIRSMGGFDARVTLAVPAKGRGPADARSLTAVGTLGVGQGDELEVRAVGPEAAEALAALRRLAEEGFGEPGDLAGEPSQSDVGPTVAESVAGPAAGHVETAPAVAPPIVAPPAGTVLPGIAASPGIAVGAARVLRPISGPPPNGIHSHPAAEWASLQAALAAAATDVRRSRDAIVGRAGVEEAAIFDAHLLLLEDPALLSGTREAIFADGLPAARAWSDSVTDAAHTWESLEDPYQRARAADLRDVGRRVLGHLTDAAAEAASDTAAAGEETPAAPASVEPTIVVADELTPADVAALDPAAVAGVADARGGPTSHAVILARALDLPVVVGTGASLLAVPDGTLLIVDGDTGTVTVQPAPQERAAAERRRTTRVREKAAAERLAAEPAVTCDGVAVSVAANASSAEDARAAVAAGADGIGLLRTEFLFLGAARMPDESEQAVAYEGVAAALEGRPLTIRTLDAGADKPLPCLPLPPERNPFLGVRGLRLGLMYPDQLRAQLRAVLHVAARWPVRVMFPMVADVDELRRARGLLDAARDDLAADGAPAPEHLEVGIMLEVPSAALLAEHLAPLVDFFSVGTNDLTQYVLAAERGNPGVAALGDSLHPAVLRLIGRAAEAALAASRTVAVCGELAGDPVAIPLLIGLGVRELSVSPVHIAAAKQAVRNTDLAAARSLAATALAADSAAAVRRLLADAAVLE